MDKSKHIVLAHGGGGQLTDELIANTLLPRLGNETLGQLLDSSIVPGTAERMAMTIDSYVVRPLFFPGGDIGRLAVCGTVNDLAVCGAEPLGLALSLIMAEGLEREVLESAMNSVREAADEAGVKVITGDTKVVGRGQADGMYITTAGVGSVREGPRLHPDQIRAGDKLIISGTIADHGLAVMLAREMPEVQSVLRSDVAPLNRMIGRLLDKVSGVVFMRDPTRGGLACVAADIAGRTGLHVVLDEGRIPIRAETRHAADMLGLEVLEVANEGKVVVVVRPEAAEAALGALREDEHGRDARIIGQVEDTRDGLCELQTVLGGRRIMLKPYGEQLSRIC